MSADCIRYDDGTDTYGFDGQIHRKRGNCAIVVHDGVVYIDEPEQLKDCKPITADFIGKVVARALSNGVTTIRFDNVTVTVNYLVEMLRFTGKKGWFYDCLSTTEDHAFDNNAPTPGAAWNEARELVTEARQHEDYALKARFVHLDDEANTAESLGRDCRRRARRLCRNGR